MTLARSNTCMPRHPPGQQPRYRCPGFSRGFTLIEVMVALAVMAVMAALGWRSLDAMLRTQQTVGQRSDQVLALQAGLGQWQADLDALVETGQLSAIDYDGRVLRLTRRDSVDAGAGVRVVAWSRLPGAQGLRWMRWQSPPLTSRGQLDEAWARAQAWGRGAVRDDARLQVDVAALEAFEIFYFRGDAWTNPMSADAATPASAPAALPPGTGPAAGTGTGTGLGAGGLGRQIDAAIANGTLASVPDGVRLVLRLGEGQGAAQDAAQAIRGTLVLDWARPVLGGGKS